MPESRGTGSIIYGCVHGRMTTEISVMYAIEEVKLYMGCFICAIKWWLVTKPVNKIIQVFQVFLIYQTRSPPIHQKNQQKTFKISAKSKCTLSSSFNPRTPISYKIVCVFFCIKLDSFLIVCQIDFFPVITRDITRKHLKLPPKPKSPLKCRLSCLFNSCTLIIILSAYIYKFKNTLYPRK